MLDTWRGEKSMTLKEAIESGKPFKHKKDKWYYTEPANYMLKVLSDEWEIVDEIPDEQLSMDSLYAGSCFRFGNSNE